MQLLYTGMQTKGQLKPVMPLLSYAKNIYITFIFILLITLQTSTFSVQALVNPYVVLQQPGT